MYELHLNWICAIKQNVFFYFLQFTNLYQNLQMIVNSQFYTIHP